VPSDDLLRFIGSPLPFSSWWLWAGVIIVVAVIAWCAAVYVWTLSPARLRTLPLLNRLHTALVRRRFARAVRRTREHYLAGGLSAAQAGAQVSRTLRSFLYVSTGVRAQYLHVGAIAAGPLAPARPLFDALNDIQFNRTARSDFAAVSDSAEEFIRSWN